MNLQKEKKIKTHSATKVFQALRIFVNKEISELIYGLINAAKVVKKRWNYCSCYISFFEDKIVKYFFKSLSENKSVSHDICQKMKKKLIYLNPLIKNQLYHQKRN